MAEIRFKQLPGSLVFEHVITDPKVLKLDSMGVKPLSVILYVAFVSYFNEVPDFIPWLNDRDIQYTVAWHVQDTLDQDDFKATVFLSIADPDQAFEFRMRWT